jgi:hypothetical protein
MSANTSPISNIPLKILFENNENQVNYDQFLSIEITTISQPLIKFNTNNMTSSQIPLIAPVPQHKNAGHIDSKFTW